MKRSLKGVSALSLALFALVAACTGNPEDSPTSGPPDAGEQVARLAENGYPIARATMESPVEMPFIPYYAAGDRLRTAVEQTEKETSRAWLVAFEEFTAQCMKDAGFTYYPETDALELDAESTERPGLMLAIPWLPSDVDDVRRFGYGVSPSEEVSLEGQALPEAEARNAQYREGLSAAAQREYDFALMGHYDYATAANPDPGACRTLGQAAHPAPATRTSARTTDLLASLDSITQGALDLTPSTAGEGFTENMGNDPRLASLNQEYVECVLVNKQGSWYSDEVMDPSSMMGIAWGTAEDGSVFDPQGATEVSVADIPPQYRGLKANTAQINIALTDFQCRAATDYVNRYAEIQFDAEQAYIDQFKRELDQLLGDIEEELGRLG
ncbi:MAG: hypothetical protein LBC97_03165 [Bifidobacteriaceae bacterium]|jgi:hypothetical protein|nr:hypothetical protein [Bifidobacteriaceae bacterium]